MLPISMNSIFFETWDPFKSVSRSNYKVFAGLAQSIKSVYPSVNAINYPGTVCSLQIAPQAAADQALVDQGKIAYSQ